MNRVSFIKFYSGVDKSFHVTGKDNPADLLTRTVSVADILEKEWWFNGAGWLVSDNLEHVDLIC